MCGALALRLVDWQVTQSNHGFACLPAVSTVRQSCNCNNGAEANTGCIGACATKTTFPSAITDSGVPGVPYPRYR